MQNLATAIFGAFLALVLPPLSQAQPTIDGDLTDVEYNQVVDADSANGFGSNNEIDALYYYADEANENLYIGIEGKLEDATRIGYAIWINIAGSDAPTGKPAGSELGFSDPADLLYIDGILGDNQGYTADFEVDYALAIHADENGGTEAAAATYTSSSPSGTNFGSTDQSGSSASSQGPNNSEVIDWAFDDTSDDSGVSESGAEFRIPFAEVEASTSNGLELSAMIVDHDAEFSNETIPGDGTQIAGGNPGPFAKWESYDGGPYHLSGGTLPVELVSFDALQSNQHAVLRWTTASETDNSGYHVQHAVGDQSFAEVGWVEGGGTTTETQTYSYPVENLSVGTHQFRLKQVDLDGSSQVHGPISVDVQMQEAIRLTAPAPNPVSSTATLSFAVKEQTQATVAVYDMLGRKARALFDGSPTPGESTRLRIDASGLPSGPYIIRLRADGQTETRRMTVVR